MRNKIFLDTCALFAYFDKSDIEHKKISEFIDSSTFKLFTSNYIVDELITLLRYRKFSIDILKQFIDEIWMQSFCKLIYVSPAIEQKAWKLLVKYKEHRFSFTDCTSFIIMRENSITSVCSMDHHFKLMGFDVFP